MKQPVPPEPLAVAVAVEPLAAPESAHGAVVGRPTKLTPEVAQKIITALRNGAFRQTAAQWAGVAPETLSRWLSRTGEPYESFTQEVEQAEAGLELRCVHAIMSQIDLKPELAAWFLERKYPSRWGKGRANAPRGQVNIDLMLETIHRRRATISDPRGLKPLPAGGVDAQSDDPRSRQRDGNCAPAL